ncbi:hypothetical protein Y032_1083g3574 [Ancylostoma ceylanicum]|uniref:Uncharacterized protein n=1 Tax=Ancylostoma ceylanicum TaxID=53326 RepID=A0A016W6N2_9BILA|nr:hypothetical protein Y032_1083g3574 [Ancylostoma ceylanicum]
MSTGFHKSPVARSGRYLFLSDHTMPATRKSVSTAKSTKAYSQPTASSEPTTDFHGSGSGKEEVIHRLQVILNDKAPEGLPLLNQLLQLLKPNPLEIVEAEKRARSIVIAGIPEAGSDLEPLDRVNHTEAMTHKVLNALGVEARPNEIYRMGNVMEGKTRLIKCVLPSERFLFTALRNAPALRNLTGFDHVYIRRSMTREEREKDKELRRQAHNLNLTEHNGRKVYVVYRNQVVKASEIPQIKARDSKNL